MSEGKINVFRAVAMARATMGTDGEFSIKFRKWNRRKEEGGDLCFIKRARCRPAPMKGDLANSEYKLFMTDLDKGQPVTCWQPLIVEFNGQRCNLE